MSEPDPPATPVEASKSPRVGLSISLILMTPLLLIVGFVWAVGAVLGSGCADSGLCHAGPGSFWGYAVLTPAVLGVIGLVAARRFRITWAPMACWGVASIVVTVFATLP